MILKKQNIRFYKDKLSKRELDNLLKKFKIKNMSYEDYEELLNEEMQNIHFKLMKHLNNITNKFFLKQFVKFSKIKVIIKSELYNNIIRDDYVIMDSNIIKIIKVIDLNKENV